MLFNLRMFFYLTSEADISIKQELIQSLCDFHSRPGLDVSKALPANCQAVQNSSLATDFQHLFQSTGPGILIQATVPALPLLVIF